MLARSGSSEHSEWKYEDVQMWKCEDMQMFKMLVQGLVEAKFEKNDILTAT